MNGLNFFAAIATNHQRKLKLMLINYMSDVHTEFDRNFPSGSSMPVLTNEVGADVLVLAGDISVKENVDFHLEASKKYKHVIALMGNHEYYRGKYPDTLHNMQYKLKDTNVHLLNDESITLDGVTFHCATLWTDGGKYDPLTIHRIDGALNDFRLIRTDGGASRFTAKYSTDLHRRSVDILKNNIKEGDVVVTHHAPSFKSLHPRYANEPELNCAYMSDLEDLMLDTKPALWFHGHVHTSFDYMVGNTRVLCNPRGYFSYEENPDFDINKTVEV